MHFLPLRPLPSGGRQHSIFQSHYRNNCSACHACTCIVRGHTLPESTAGFPANSFAVISGKARGLGSDVISWPWTAGPSLQRSLWTGPGAGQGLLSALAPLTSHRPADGGGVPSARVLLAPETVGKHAPHPPTSGCSLPNGQASSAQKGHHNLVIKLGARGKQHN